MTEAVRMEDIELEIRQLKCKKAPGLDGVTNYMIKNFGLLTKRTLLKLFNESWKTVTVPAMWKKATIIPIHKKGNDKKTLNNYRPISLRSRLGKLLEKVINRRLLSFLEDNNVLSQTESTEAQKHGRSACSYCPRDRECIPKKEECCRNLL